VDQKTNKTVDIEPTNEFSESKSIEMVSDFSSEKLGDIIVMYRYIGLYPNLSIAAMQELAHRREAGDNFLYEEYIDNNLQKSPKLSFEIPSIHVLLEQLKKIV
jgi:hypothetical protein